MYMKQLVLADLSQSEATQRAHPTPTHNSSFQSSNTFAEGYIPFDREGVEEEGEGEE